MHSLNRALFLCLFVVSSLIYGQQITVDNAVSPQDLIENTLIQGCVEVSNISSPVNGSTIGLGSYGYFERGASNFPFENGIVLTTGDANSAGNGLNSSVLNDGDDSWITDPDLESALGINGTLNATSIEFDFISTAYQIQFNYILASEEYFGNFPCEYLDGFALLIRESGSGNPYVNIALVPGTNTPVNTNTVHDEIVGFCDASNETYFDGYNLGDTNYNGRTTVLTAAASIQPNVQYQIKLIIADQTDENYDSAVFIEGNSFNAAVDLGDDFSTCASEVTLNGDIGNNLATYTWFLDNVVIPGENASTLNVTQTGNYRVEIEIPLAGSTCIIEDDISITLSSTQSSDPITDFEVCDDPSNDGVETFDLSLKDAEVLASVPPANYNITYHFSAPAAQVGINPITSPIQNVVNPQVIFVRIEDTTNGCLAFSSFSLVVNEIPNIVDPTPLIVCDDQNADGSTSIDLSIKNDEITNNQSNLLVSYYNTQNAAELGIDPLSLPYTNTNTNEQIYVRVVNPQTGCAATTTLNIEVLDTPVIDRGDHYIDACDADHDGFADFDLTTIIDDVIQGLTGVSISFHETNEDALAGTNPIADDTSYPNVIEEEQIIYIRVEDDATGCASVTPIEIHTNLLLTATEIRDFSRCDIGNDGVEDFGLTDIAGTIINEIPDITIDFYLTEDDRDNQINPIDTSVPFTPTSNPQTLYLWLSSPTCDDIAQIELSINPIFEFDNIVNQTVCDEDQDGITTTDLSQFDSLVSNGLDGYDILYFLSETDANSGENALDTMYTNSTNPFTIYPRIRANNTGCFDITSFQITVVEAPTTTQPSDFIVCDDDQDGFSIVDLNDIIPEVVSSTNNLQISFHFTQDDADQFVSRILPIDNYNAQTETLYIRVENMTTGCYSTEVANIIVNTLPVFTAIDNYKICEDAGDGFGDFIFNTKDDEILNGQTGKQVLYFLTENDAINRTNPIDKDVAYQNVTNPQTIFVRVENLTDEDCFGTTSFTVEVGVNPLYNDPTDWFICDSVENDGFETFDLNTKITEITQSIPENLTVTFYISFEDAENSINPLPLDFTNTSNPQTIYAQIDNGTICNAIRPFELNVIQVPEINDALPITTCDDDYDGITVFDLTQAEVDILDVRQDDIEIAYFESLEDANAHQNIITDPENYINTSNPQTTYIKITNTLSNCYVLAPIELTVNTPPVINNFQSYDICDNETNSFDLTEINGVLMDESFNVLFSYYLTEADAIAEQNALDTNYTYTNSTEVFFARAEFSTTHCYVTYEFSLNINPLPIANQPDDLVACDDDFDGLLSFDLSQQNAAILGTQNVSNYTITYHNTLDQATDNNSPLDLNYVAFDSEIIYVRIEDSQTGCYATTQFSVVINPLPEIDIDDQVICLDNLPLVVSANTNNPTDAYLWSTGEVTPEIEITTIGPYFVTVTTEFGCENTRVFNVSESEAATIDVTEVVDFSDPNNITVTISGIGDYLYQLDDGEPQSSNVFEDVAMGYHTITIIDVNGCSEVTRDVLVIDIPKHLTPNNDGQFDTWHIVGVETLPGTIIHIFDRYGKLLKTLSHNSPGWNGTYNGNLLPATDYWFVAAVQRGNESFEVKGHFTLRR